MQIKKWFVQLDKLPRMKVKMVNKSSKLSKSNTKARKISMTEAKGRRRG
jgi:hypothetical protein